MAETHRRLQLQGKVCGWRCEYELSCLQKEYLRVQRQGGGGAFAYVKFIKPKHGVKVSADPDDYDFEDEEMVNEDEQEVIGD